MTQHFPPAAASSAANREKPTRTALIEIGLFTLVTFLAMFAFAGVFRYGLAFYGRAHLLPGVLAALSGALLNFAFSSSIILIVATEAALAWWLWVERDLAYAANRRTDPRRWWEILLLALVPLVNLVSLGVLLNELLIEQERDGRRSWQPALRSWWIWWSGAHLAVLGVLLWRLDHSVQAQTEALLLGSVAGVVLLLLVLRTRKLLAAIEASKHPLVADGADKPTRWVVAAETPSQPEPTAAPQLAAAPELTSA